MRKLAVLIVGSGSHFGRGGRAAPGIPPFPTVPGNWSHIDINRKIGRNWHTLTLDRGKITQVNAVQLTLREPDGTVTVIPLTPQAIVRIRGA